MFFGSVADSDNWSLHLLNVLFLNFFSVNRLWNAVIESVPVKRILQIHFTSKRFDRPHFYLRLFELIDRVKSSVVKVIIISGSEPNHVMRNGIDLQCPEEPFCLTTIIREIKKYIPSCFPNLKTLVVSDGSFNQYLAEEFRVQLADLFFTPTQRRLVLRNFAIMGIGRQNHSDFSVGFDAIIKDAHFDLNHSGNFDDMLWTVLERDCPQHSPAERNCVREFLMRRLESEKVKEIYEEEFKKVVAS